MRGTTPTMTLRLPFDASMVKKAKLVVKYNGEVLIKRDTDNIKIADSALTVRMTREETVKLPDKEMVKVQWEIETPSGDALKTVVYHVYSSELLDEEALV